MLRILATATVGAALLLAACGDDDAEESAPNTDGSQVSSPEPDGEQPAKKQPRPEKDQPKPGIEIKLGDSQFGEMLFNRDDQAIYLFDKESSEKPECYGACAAAWPPVVTDGEPVAAGGVKRGLLGTTERKDGSTQVTYDGQPLYYYAHEDPSQVLCHNVSEFGGLWLVLGPDGQAL
jgi:predicted lipoprotein with Yx(FWY)xxD motif